MNAIKLIVATLSHFNKNHLSAENYDTLTTNANQYCQKLLKKSDQCEALILCLHLFLNQAYSNPDQFEKQVQKIVKIAAVSMQNPKNLILFVHILNKYLYFLDSHSKINIDEINKLIDLINEHISSIRSDGKAEEAKQSIQYFAKTLDSIKFKQTKSDRYNGIIVQ